MKMLQLHDDCKRHKMPEHQNINDGLRRQDLALDGALKCLIPNCGACVQVICLLSS